MTKSSRNNLIRFLIFIIIAGCLVFYLNQVFSLAASEESKETFNTFYNEKENTLDGAYFGASSANRYWIAPRAFHKEGIAIGSLATTSQPLVLTQYLMEEVEKTQNPKLFIVELRWVFKNADFLAEAFIRKVTDSMRPSLNRIRAINAGVDFALQGDNDVVDNKLDYYIPIIRYHGRWEGGDLTTDDLLLTGPQSESKGFFLTPSASFRQVKQEEAAYTDKTTPLAPETEAALLGLLDYCDNLDKADVLFVLSPHSVKDKNVTYLNEAVEIVESRGYPVLNFNTKKMIEKVGIDFEKDFFNANHTNVAGAEKYTDWLAHYIVKHYDMEDHRGDPDYESWDAAYEYYVDYTKVKKAKMKK